MHATNLFYTISYSREMKKSHWHHEASKLPHSEYFTQQKDTRKFDYVGFLRFPSQVYQRLRPLAQSLEERCDLDSLEQYNPEAA